MAEKAQSANHSASLIPVKAEAIAYTVASLAVSLLPIILVGAAMFLVLKGYDTAALITGLVGIAGAGPQIIAATKRSFGSTPGKSSDGNGK